MEASTLSPGIIQAHGKRPVVHLHTSHRTKPNYHPMACLWDGRIFGSGDYKHTPVCVMLSLEAVSVPCLSPELFPDPQGRGKQAGVMKSAPHVAEASGLLVLSGKTFTSLREEDTENAIWGACIRIQQIGPQATLTEATTGLGCGGTSPQTAPSCSVGGLGGRRARVNPESRCHPCRSPGACGRGAPEVFVLRLFSLLQGSLSCWVARRAG